MYSLGELESLIKKVKTDFTLLVDKDGHERFLEGDLKDDEIEGVTLSYKKWSLSGSHLLIVVAGSVEDTTALTGQLASFEPPQWIYDKVYPIAEGSTIAQFSVTLFSSDVQSSQNITGRLRKLNNKLDVRFPGSVTMTAKRYFRIQIDLLIDNE